MQSGLKPNTIDHRDYDFFKTFGAVSSLEINLPNEYIVESGWKPDQRLYETVFGNQPQPFGCTNYTTCDLCAAQDGILYNPAFTENFTHANANGGATVRDSLLSAIKFGTQGIDNIIRKRTAFYNIQKYQQLDWFDSIRYSMLPTIGEKRTVSWGTPWYTEWENAGNTLNGIVPEVNNYNKSVQSWHNSEFVGWKTIAGVPYLINKSWQGTNFGDSGYLYFPREVVNAVMEVKGTCAYTVSKIVPGSGFKMIDTTLMEWAHSIIRNIFTPKIDMKTQLLNVMCSAIQHREGWFEGSTSFRNKNPGNLKFNGQIGTIGQDSRGFAIFKDYESGLNALKKQIHIVASGNSRVYPKPCNLSQFFAIYAPSNDGNDPHSYASEVAGKMGVPVTWELSNLI